MKNKKKTLVEEKPQYQKQNLKYLPPEPDLLCDCPPPDIQDGNDSSAQFHKDFNKIKIEDGQVKRYVHTQIVKNPKVLSNDLSSCAAHVCTFSSSTTNL